MFRDSTAIAVVQVASVLLAMLQGVIIARTFSLEAMGYFQLILAFIAIGRLTALPGMDAVVVKGVLKDYDPIYYAVLKRSMIAAAIASLAVMGVGGIILFLYPANKMGLVLLVAGFFLPVAGMEKYESFFQGKRDFILSRKLALLSSLGQLLMVGLAALVFKNLMFVLAALFVNRVATNALCLHILQRKIVRQPVDPAFENELLVQGWRMSGLSVFNLIVAQIDRLILGVLDVKLLALYHIGTVLPKRIKDNVKNLLVVPTTHWSKLSKEEHLAKVRRHMLGLIAFGVLLVLAIWFASPWLIPLLYGEPYRQSVWYAQIFALSIPALFLANMIEMININQDNGVYYQKTLVIKQVIYLAALALLVPRYGVMGIIGSILLRDYLNLSMQYIYLRRNSG
ncbi:MAG: hypothetical protein C4567_04610 [Deltaproteobacteria bacterium]|nr:MAG: hypothetical protein C4567_04610 [Deltaproteobacteria bacterium]